MINKKGVFFGIYAGFCLAIGYSIYGFVDLPVFVGPIIALTLLMLAFIFYFFTTHAKTNIEKKTEEEETTETINIDFADLERLLNEAAASQETVNKDNSNQVNSDLEDKINQAIKNQQIEFVIQPIVSLPQEAVKFYECFARLKLKDTANNLKADAFIASTKCNQTAHIIDNALFFHATNIIRDTQHKKYETIIFCNFSPETILNKDFYARLVNFTTEERAILKSLAFEFNAAHLKNMEVDFLQRLDMLAKLGVCFSLDNITDLETLDFKYLESFCFRFIKVDASVLDQMLHDEQGDRKIITFQSNAHQANILPIVSRIETAAQLEIINQFGFSLGQGYYFCAPTHIKSTKEQPTTGT